MAEIKLKAVIDAEDRSKSAITSFRLSTERLGDQMKGLMTIAAGMAVALGYGAIKAIEAYGQQERAEARLAAGLANVQTVTNETMRTMTGYASELQKVTTFGDEMIISGMAMLSTFQLNDQQIMALTPRVLDMAAALEKSSGQTQDLEQIALALGKAMTSGIGILGRYGVVISDAAKKEFELASQSEKLNILMGELDKNFKGIAETVGETATGRLKIFRNMMSDIQENIGAGLIPVMNELLVLLGAQASGFNRLGSAALETFRAVSYVYEGFANLIRLMGQTTLGFQSLWYDMNRTSAEMNLNASIAQNNKEGIEKWRKELENLDKKIIETGETSLQLDQAFLELLMRMDEAEIKLKREEGSWTALNGVLNKSGQAYKNLAETSDEAMKKIREENGKVIDSLKKLSDAYYGLEDKTVAALQKAIDLRKERMETEEALGYPKSLTDIQEIMKAEQEINKIRMQRSVMTTEDIMAWAKGEKTFMETQIGGLGLTPPAIIYPQLPVSGPTPAGAVQNFSFNFEGAFIGNKDAFIAEIINMINRNSQLRALAGL